MKYLLPLLFVLTLPAQTWHQWGQNARHTGAAVIRGQKPERIFGQFTYDTLADQIRQDTGGELLVHYMAPLVDRDEVFIMTRGDSQWFSCRDHQHPCGTDLWSQMHWGVTKLRLRHDQLETEWSQMSTWTPPPDNGSGWEPVFHPAVAGEFLYMPGAAGMLMKFDRRMGMFIDCLSPFADTNPNRFITSPLTVAGRSIYYTVMTLDPAQPWAADVQGAWLVKISSAAEVEKVSFADLIANPPAGNCTTTFDQNSLPWPPAPDAVAPQAPCGSQRPALNAAPAVARDGTIYVVSRAHFNPAYSYLVAVNPDLTLNWTASLRDRLSDGCDKLLPPSGTVGGCRAGSQPGVDPATNQPPAGNVVDQSSASPVIAPDGSILYGAYTRYNYGRGHLFHFSSAGDFLNSYDFGWDITPAIYEHDRTWSAVLKDNHYPTGSYCAVIGQCGQGDESYLMTSLTPGLTIEWTYPSGSNAEWCVNMVAVDREGTIYANNEDGKLYAIDRRGVLLGDIFLKQALGAAYTPLAIGPEGRVYTQNDGTLFVTGSHRH